MMMCGQIFCWLGDAAKNLPSTVPVRPERPLFFENLLLLLLSRLLLLVSFVVIFDKDLAARNKFRTCFFFLPLLMLLLVLLFVIIQQRRSRIEHFRWELCERQRPTMFLPCGLSGWRHDHVRAKFGLWRNLEHRAKLPQTRRRRRADRANSRIQEHIAIWNARALVLAVVCRG